MRSARNLELAVIGNCEIAALIDADATIVYCSLPRLDGDPVGLVPARDPRFVSTVSAIDASLKDGDRLFRYRHRDDFSKPHTSFTVCAFWYVNALAMMGRCDEARAHFERLLAQRTRLGLLSEDIDAKTGEGWGNFPQTYSLVGIINSAIRLSRPWEEDP